MLLKAGIFLLVVAAFSLLIVKLSHENNKRAKREKELTETLSKAH
jgi:hypothetical protein